MPDGGNATISWVDSFTGRSDLQPYGDNAVGLFALALRFGIDDLQTVAANALTDGSDDKSCDLLHVDRENKVAVIAQCYHSSKDKPSAPSKKAMDLNTAITWILGQPVEKLPVSIKAAATELRAALEEGALEELHLWFVHNLPESKNVRDELVAAETTAKALINEHFSCPALNIGSLEVGLNQLDEWYRETLSPILVTDTFEIEVGGGFPVSGPKWKAFVAPIPARFLHRNYKKYGVRLFSANLRDYLGSRESDSNINNGIKKTASNDPENFWAFNNGLTILVNSFEPPLSKKDKLQISGMSIVNGAQTTGAIGSLSKMPDKACLVPARFVCTEDADVVQEIIRYNNSQNKVTASDFRSTDRIQKRLREEFKDVPGAEYEGGRRGGSGDAIKRRPHLLPSYTVGQALAAFHGDAIVAYNQKSEIWSNDTLYSRYFDDKTTAHHIVFCYGLLKAVEDKKLLLLAKSKKSELTKGEEAQLSVFRKRGATYVFTSAVAACLETFAGSRVANPWRVSFGLACSPKKSQDHWAALVDLTSPFLVQLEEAFADGLKNAEKIRAGVQRFASLVEATADSNGMRYKAFSKLLVRK